MLLLILALIIPISAMGQGITFFEGTWDQTVNEAKKENKLIFVDFYAQWCGPCLNMAEAVFPLPDVGSFYNTHFISAKIDAENGEGIALAKKYGVTKYPTYLFIDPATEEVVHESSSRQSGEQFIYTGHSAVTPRLRSFYLTENYEKGVHDTDFLLHFIQFQSSVYNSKMVREAFDKLMANGEKLSDPKIWNVFVENLSGHDNPYIQYVSDNYTAFYNLFGKEVDKKLAKETTYMPLESLDNLHDFEGKEFNRKMIVIDLAIKSKNYGEAAKDIDALLQDTTTDKEELINRLEFIARGGLRQKESKEWFEDCLNYARYIAYNKSDRKDPYIHQDYASALETVIKQVINGESKALPAFLGEEPKYGKKEYSMRHDKLKAKPVKK